MSESSTTRSSAAGEDQLLLQIDAFRDKALELQQLIDGKQSRVEELQKIVEEKEEESRTLDAQLSKTKSDTGDLMNEVRSDVADLVSEVRTTMTKTGEDLLDRQKQHDEAVDKQLRQVSDSVSGACEEIGSYQNRISEKIHSENVVQYRNLQELLKESDSSEELLEQIKKQSRSIKARLNVLMIFSIASLAALAVLVLNVIGLI